MQLLNPPSQILDIAPARAWRAGAWPSKAAIVTGIDAAIALIEAAKRRNQTDRLPITYLVGDATKLSEQPDLQPIFDAAMCILAIQNLTPLSPVWQGIKALLKPGSRTGDRSHHPCFRIPKESSWGWDDAAAVQYRRVDQYLTSSKTEIQMHPGAAPTETTTTFHRPLQAYINTLGNAGLLIDHIDEWTSHKISEAGPKKAAADNPCGKFPCSWPSGRTVSFHAARFSRNARQVFLDVHCSTRSTAPVNVSGIQYTQNIAVNANMGSNALRRPNNKVCLSCAKPYTVSTTNDNPATPTGGIQNGQCNRRRTVSSTMLTTAVMAAVHRPKIRINTMPAGKNSGPPKSRLVVAATINSTMKATTNTTNGTTTNSTRLMHKAIVWLLSNIAPPTKAEKKLVGLALGV